MKHSDISLKIKKFAERYGFLIVSLGFLITAFLLLPDYGAGFDSPKNFDEGRINLNYLLTGQTPLLNQFSLTYQIHGAFFFMVSDLLKRLLSDSLGWLDPVSARHILLPGLVFFFINLFYAFLRKRADPRTAFLACALLLTTPHFWGHLFNNIKDIPLFVCFSLALFSFYEWRASGFQRSRYLYGTFLALALTLLSKLYGVLIPVILALWLTLPKLLPGGRAEALAPGTPWSRKNLYHGLIGLGLTLALLALFFMPAFYAVEEKMLFLKMKGRVVKGLMDHASRSWSLLPWVQIFFITPVLTLAAALGGLIRTLVQKPLSSLASLMLAWFFTVMIAACTPLFPVYHGIRLFMVILVPLCFFAGVGILEAAALSGKIFPRLKTPGAWILGTVLIAVQIAGIVQTHPYETTFFNRLAGGLKGAQEKHIPDAADYWLTSYREAVQWINRNAPANAFLWVPSLDDYYMLRLYAFRKDLRYHFVLKTPVPRNSFLILQPGKACWINSVMDLRKEIVEESNRMQKVHEIRRQGGEIASIYYKP
jgi:hypothetical protein